MNKIFLFIVIALLIGILWWFDWKKLNKKLKKEVQKLNKDFKDAYSGKRILVKLKFMNDQGKKVGEYETDGIIDKIDDSGLLIIKRINESEFQIPFNNKAIKTLNTSKKNGIEYLSEWEISPVQINEIDSYKKNGFKKL